MSFGRRRNNDVGVARTPAAASAKTPEDSVTPGLRVAAAYSWRILAVLGVIAVFVFLVIEFRVIVIPFLVALLVSALLVPLVNLLTRHGWPKWLAVVLAVVGALLVISGLIFIVYAQIRAGFPNLQERSIAAYESLKQFLADSPLHLKDSDITGYLDQFLQSIQQGGQVVINGALSVGSTAGRLVAGFLLVLFATILILIDGKGTWAWVVRLFPRNARPALDGSGKAGWLTLTTFVKVQIFVAAVDATGIGLGAWILGLFFGGFPLVIPIAIAVFLGSFIPVVGAVLSGSIAVFVALVYLGPVPALIMVGIVLLVQLVEGHLLQPLVMGTAVKVHPLAIVFAVAAGALVAGIPGALFAVPVVATLNVMVKYIARGEWRVLEPAPGESAPRRG